MAEGRRLRRQRRTQGHQSCEQPLRSTAKVPNCSAYSESLAAHGSVQRGCGKGYGGGQGSPRARFRVYVAGRCCRERRSRFRLCAGADLVLPEREEQEENQLSPVSSADTGSPVLISPRWFFKSVPYLVRQPC